MAVDDVSFEVRAGEILGVAGVQGNGQTELVEAITGLRDAAIGAVRSACWARTSPHASPRRITELGAAHVPEDRQRDGLVLSFTGRRQPGALQTYYLPPFARGVGAAARGAILAARPRAHIGEFDIRTPSPLTTGRLAFGRQPAEGDRGARVLAADPPAGGVAADARPGCRLDRVHPRAASCRSARKDCAVLLVSPELDEILELSDRIAVMYRGQIVGTARRR